MYPAIIKSYFLDKAGTYLFNTVDSRLRKAPSFKLTWIFILTPVRVVRSLFLHQIKIYTRQELFRSLIGEINYRRGRINSNSS